jgi:hypothetical protein
MITTFECVAEGVLLEITSIFSSSSAKGYFSTFIGSNKRHVVLAPG